MSVMLSSILLLALTSDGKLFSFGENESGQLGLGHDESCVHPTLIESLKDVKISQISCGSEHAGAVTGVYFAECYHLKLCIDFLLF